MSTPKTNWDLLTWYSNSLCIDMDGKGTYSYPELMPPMVHWCKGEPGDSDADLSQLPVVTCLGCAATVTLDAEHAAELAREHKARQWKRGELEGC